MQTTQSAARQLTPCAQIPPPSKPGTTYGWNFNSLCGRFIELCEVPGAPALSSAAGLILETQRQHELSAWISARDSIFYPPDLAALGIDLRALPVVRTRDADAGWRVADILLRSGGFRLILLDLGAGAQCPLAAQSRLGALAQKHRSILLNIVAAHNPATARGSLVSLRMAATLHRLGHDCFSCELTALKDKNHPEEWKHAEVRYGTDGLC